LAPQTGAILGGGITAAMDYEFRDQKLYLRRSLEERAPLLLRLRRIEGQIRGIHQMIEDDRYCPDELQQLKAASAAIRELGVVLTEQHLAVAIQASLEGSDDVLQDMRNTISAVLKL
jgi:DNA-binding FrmR family transcriptional regulator